jgi:hypothetical protein
VGSLQTSPQRSASWLGTTHDRPHSLLLLVWPLVTLIIAVLVIGRASTAKDLADLISAVASLMWPVVTVAMVNWFRPEIRATLSRIRKGKFLGQEIELDELQAKTVAAEEKAEDWGTSSGASEPQLEAYGSCPRCCSYRRADYRGYQGYREAKPERFRSLGGCR